MFTGIIEAQGYLKSRRTSGGDICLVVHSDTLNFSDVSLGDSIATNGVCLTVVEFGDHFFAADVSNETLAHTTLGLLPLNTPLNLEKALLPTTRLGGHIVSGHVDAVATITQVQKEARSIQLRLKLDGTLLKYIAHKGSICIDGTSLTVNAIEGDEVLLNIVPHTAQETLTSTYRVGTKVNVEVDIIARYLERLFLGKDNSSAKAEGVTLDLLARSGFIR